MVRSVVDSVKKYIEISRKTERSKRKIKQLSLSWFHIYLKIRLKLVR